MSSSSEKVLTGESWSYAFPIPNPCHYFEFTPEVGGVMDSPATLIYQCVCLDSKKLLNQILEIKTSYPHCNFLIEYEGSSNIGLEIFTRSFYDFDFHFALEIEALIEDFNRAGEIKPLVGKIDCDKRDIYRHAIVPSNHQFTTPGIGWEYIASELSTGLAATRIRIELHHEQNPDFDKFLLEVKALTDRCSIEYVQYQSRAHNYVFLVGNGRQGMGGAAVNLSDIHGFEFGLLPIIEESGFILGLKPNWTRTTVATNYKSNAELLRTSNVIVIKDVRHK